MGCRRYTGWTELWRPPAGLGALVVASAYLVRRISALDFALFPLDLGLDEPKAVHVVFFGLVRVGVHAPAGSIRDHQVQAGVLVAGVTLGLREGHGAAKGA